MLFDFTEGTKIMTAQEADGLFARVKEILEKETVTEAEQGIVCSSIPVLVFLCLHPDGIQGGAGLRYQEAAFTLLGMAARFPFKENREALEILVKKAWNDVPHLVARFAGQVWLWENIRREDFVPVQEYFGESLLSVVPEGEILKGVAEYLLSLDPQSPYTKWIASAMEKDFFLTLLLALGKKIDHALFSNLAIAVAGWCLEIRD